jgi:hypothetical protein
LEEEAHISFELLLVCIRNSIQNDLEEEAHFPL